MTGWLLCASCTVGLTASPGDSDPATTADDSAAPTDSVDTTKAPPFDTPDPADTDVSPADSDTPPVETDPPPVETDTPAPDTPRPAADLVPGDLLITEFMADPDDCPDGEGEYIELVHPGTDPIDIEGVILEDDNHRWTLPALVLAGGGRTVLFRDPAPALQCYGLTGLAYEADLGLDADGDRVTITSPTGARIERVDFSAWEVTPGVAWERDDQAPSRWCPADRRIPGATDRGSPGALNGPCSL